jgi:hypothetical protein
MNEIILITITFAISGLIVFLRATSRFQISEKEEGYLNSFHRKIVLKEGNKVSRL